MTALQHIQEATKLAEESGDKHLQVILLLVSGAIHGGQTVEVSKWMVDIAKRIMIPDLHEKMNRLL